MIHSCVLRDSLHCLVENDDHNIVVEAFSEHNRKQRRILFKLDERHESNNVRAGQDGAHVAHGVDVERPWGALNVHLAIVKQFTPGYPANLKQRVSERGQEHEREQSAKEAELRNIGNVGKEFASPDVVSSSEDNEWQQELKEQVVVPLQDGVGLLM